MATMIFCKIEIHVIIKIIIIIKNNHFVIIFSNTISDIEIKILSDYYTEIISLSIQDIFLFLKLPFFKKSEKTLLLQEQMLSAVYTIVATEKRKVKFPDFSPTILRKFHVENSIIKSDSTPQFAFKSNQTFNFFKNP